MAQIERWSEVVWEGSLTAGSGVIAHSSSGAIHDLPVTFAARVEAPEGKTSPEELLAAAHAVCYAMVISNILNKQGTPPEQLTVKATCTLSRGDAGLTIEAMHLDLTGRAAGVDEAALQAVAEEGKTACPVSRALANNVRITVSAHAG